MNYFLYSFRLLLVCITLLCLGLFSAAAQQKTHANMSVAPGVLLKLMPGPLDQWKLTTSRGYCALSAGPSMKTYAVREYLGPPPKQKEGDPTPLPPPITRITVTACGAGRALDAGFENFKVGTASSEEQAAGIERCMVNGFPAIKRKTGDKAFQIRVYVSPLLFAVIDVQNQDERTLDSWAKLINFENIAQAIASLPAKPIPLAGNVQTQTVDELNPQNNQTTSINY